MIDWKAITAGALSVGLSVCGAMWFAGHRDGMLDDHERRILKLEVTSDKIGAYDVRLARIEEQLKFIIERLGTPKK